MIKQIAFPALLALSACAEIGTVSRSAQPSTFSPSLSAPADAAPGTCWDKTETPAVIETVSEDRLIQPARYAETGELQSLPIYEKTTKQVIVEDRKATWFQLVCPIDLSQPFVGSVQRALELRGFYGGPITEQMDSVTVEAIARYQISENIDFADPTKLTMDAAERMGLSIVLQSG
ncbi:MAG: peptidoglycan-binding domain-containing protein [Pseudomonadota bacterium]